MNRLSWFALLSLPLVSVSLLAQTPEKPIPNSPAKQEAPKNTAERYEYRRNHHPDGIGKFYMGRELAQVMSYHGAGWLDRPEREKEEHASKLLPPLNIKPGDHVADFGAGSGYHSLKLSKIVGDTGKVYAPDIQPEMLTIIRAKMKKTGVSNIEPILCTPTDPKLPAKSVDLILIVDVYHELASPYEVMSKLVDSLKPKGRVAFVEFRLEEDVPIKLLHRMSEKQVLAEMKPFPLRHVETQKHLPWQHVIIFEKLEER